MKPQLADALGRFLEAPNDPVEAALVVARIIDPQAEVGWARQEIRRLATVLGAAKAANIPGELARQGFAGAGKLYYEVDNNRLDHVLRTRRGIPISLGVVCLGVARHLGFPATGINFPRHFLVRTGDVLLDPYKMAPTSVETCRKWLKENDISEDGAFDVAAPRDIAQRMLNNVRSTVHERGDFARSLEITDYQLMITPNSYALHLERADAWLALEAPEMVATELEKAMRNAPTENIADRLRQRLERARRLRKSAVH